jgi:hypothetical protein
MTPNPSPKAKALEAGRQLAGVLTLGAVAACLLPTAMSPVPLALGAATIVGLVVLRA